MPKYNHIENIPAKVFFNILETKDFQKLKPKPREKELEKVFMSINDDYFIRSDNEQAKEYLRLKNIIIINHYKINLLKQNLAFYYYNPTSKEMRMEFLKALKIGYGITIDPELPFRDEVKRILDLEIGGMENEIALAEIEMNQIYPVNNESKIDFYDRIVSMSNALKGNVLVNDEMTLAVFVALEKNIRNQKENQT